MIEIKQKILNTLASNGNASIHDRVTSNKVSNTMQSRKQFNIGNYVTKKKLYKERNIIALN